MVVITEHSQLDHPELKAFWASGESFEISLRRMRPWQIEEPGWKTSHT